MSPSAVMPEWLQISIRLAEIKIPLTLPSLSLLPPLMPFNCLEKKTLVKVDLLHYPYLKGQHQELSVEEIQVLKVCKGSVTRNWLNRCFKMCNFYSYRKIILGFLPSNICFWQLPFRGLNMPQMDFTLISVLSHRISSISLGPRLQITLSLPPRSAQQDSCAG